MQGVFQNLTWTTWDVDLDSVHLLINHRFYLDLHFKTYRYFNEHNIQHYPFVFGKMARRVLNQPPIIDSKTGSKTISSFQNPIIRNPSCLIS